MDIFGIFQDGGGQARADALARQQAPFDMSHALELLREYVANNKRGSAADLGTMKAGFKAFSDQLADDLRANVGGLEPFLGSADRKVSAASAFKPMRGGGFDDGFMEVRFNEGLNADLAGITVHVEPGDRSFLAMGVNEASNAQRTHTGLLKLVFLSNFKEVKSVLKAEGLGDALRNPRSLAVLPTSGYDKEKGGKKKESSVEVAMAHLFRVNEKLKALPQASSNPLFTFRKHIAKHMATSIFTGCAMHSLSMLKSFNLKMSISDDEWAEPDTLLVRCRRFAELAAPWLLLCRRCLEEGLAHGNKKATWRSDKTKARRKEAAAAAAKGAEGAEAGGEAEEPAGEPAGGGKLSAEEAAEAAAKRLEVVVVEDEEEDEEEGEVLVLRRNV